MSLWSVAHMSGQELSTVMERIDADIVANRDRLRDDINKYLVENVDLIVDQLRRNRSAVVPTFAGDQILTEAEIRNFLAKHPA